MAFNCEDIVKKHLGRNTLTDQEILSLADQARALAKKARAGRVIADLEKTVAELSKEQVANEKLKLIAEKRAVLLNARARTHCAGFVLDEFRGMEAKGLSAILTGSARVRQGSRDSVSALFEGMKDEYRGKLWTSIEELGPEHLKVARSGEMDREIAQAITAIEKKGVQYDGPEIAMEIAAKIIGINELMRQRANQAGAWIRKINGYISSQTHDQLKIDRAGLEQWKADAETLFNWDETADGKYADVSTPEARAARDSFLLHTFRNLADGYHQKAGEGSVKEAVREPVTKANVVGSTAARLSQKRIIYFKDGEAWHEYNQKYGQKSLLMAVDAELENMARSTALMRILGPSPQTNMAAIIKDVVETLHEREDFRGVRKIKNATMHIDNRMKALDGTQNMDGNPALSAVFQFVRSIMSMSKLGFATISGFSDVPTLAMESKWQGASYFKAFGELLKGVWGGRGSIEQKKILAECGVFFDSYKGAINARYSGDVAPGIMSRMMYRYFQFNGLSLWTDVWKKSFCLWMSERLGRFKNLGWNSLQHETRRLFSMYNIDQGKWEMLRQGKMKAADGRHYLTGDVAYDIDADSIRAYLEKAGEIDIADARIKGFREQLAGEIRSMFRDRTRNAMLEPDAETNALLTQGLSSGTAAGEAMRCIMQFKQFPSLYLQRVWGRELYSRGADTFRQGFKQAFLKSGPNREMSCLAGVMLMSGLFGYLSMTTKQLLAGKTPHKIENGKDAYNVALASLLQGGGLGIFGDFLFGTYNRMGGSFYSTAAGPAAGALEQLYTLYQRIRDGEDINASAVRSFWSMIPFNNLFFIKGPAEYFLLNDLYEGLNPGYIKRMRKRIYEDSKQTFWMPEPGQLYDWSKAMSQSRLAKRKEKQREKRQARKEREGRPGFYGPQRQN